MKERPILFNAPMVRALLDGSKRQTRRVCRQQPYQNGYHWDGNDIQCHNDYLPPSAMLMDFGGKMLGSTSNLEGWEAECPHGLPGDRLWVRETFGEVYDWCDHPEMPGAPTERWHIEWKYRADGEPDTKSLDGVFTFWKPSIHMPRAASRILLEIVSVRVERLNDISEADAKAEGVIQLDADDWQRPEERAKDGWKLCPTCAGTGLHSTLGPGGGVNFDVDCHDCDTHAKLFKHLWNSTGGDWAANPWVWIIELKRITP